jgi:hypothetical protein
LVSVRGKNPAASAPYVCSAGAGSGRAHMTQNFVSVITAKQRFFRVAVILATPY